MGVNRYEVRVSGAEAWRDVLATTPREAVLIAAAGELESLRVVAVAVEDGHASHWTVERGRIVARPEYLGDGVYASADPQAGTVTLTTDRDGRTETIVLGDAMLRDLATLAKRFGVTA